MSDFSYIYMFDKVKLNDMVFFTITEIETGEVVFRINEKDEWFRHYKYKYTILSHEEKLNLHSKFAVEEIETQESYALICTYYRWIRSLFGKIKEEKKKKYPLSSSGKNFSRRYM